MTLRFMDSFDHYVTADLGKKWTSVHASATVSAGNGRNSTACLRFGNNQHYAAKTLSAQATWIVGAAFKVSTLTYEWLLMQLLDGATLHCDMRLKTDGTLSVTRNGTVLGTSVAAISANAWYYVELKATISDAAGVAVVHLNGAEILSLSGVDTRNSASASANVIRLGGPGAQQFATMDFDDVYMCDAAGSVNNDFLGDVRVEAVLPNGAGNSAQWTPSAGANYECVDDNPGNSDTDYNASSTAGHKDTYALGDLATSGGTVFGVQTNLLARKDDAGARTLRSVVRSGSSESTGATTGLGDTYTYLCDVFETKPGGGAWAVSDVNAAEAGMELVS